jgi:hypothetical protein
MSAPLMGCAAPTDGTGISDGAAGPCTALAPVVVPAVVPQAVIVTANAAMARTLDTRVDGFTLQPWRSRLRGSCGIVGIGDHCECGPGAYDGSDEFPSRQVHLDALPQSRFNLSIMRHARS